MKEIGGVRGRGGVGEEEEWGKEEVKGERSEVQKSSKLEGKWEVRESGGGSL